MSVRAGPSKTIAGTLIAENDAPLQNERFAKNATRLFNDGAVYAPMCIHDLSTHPVAYVSVGELASYWRISRKQIYKQIDAGTLPAIRLGPRLFRIRTCVARDFEEAARLAPGQVHEPTLADVRRRATSAAH